MAYMTISRRTEAISESQRAPANRRGFIGEMWSKIIFAFQVIALLFEMVAHPDRYSLDDDKS